jgi:hypothetical protein
MGIKTNRVCVLFLCFFSLFSFFSCSVKRPARFSAPGGGSLYGLSRDAAAGELRLSGGETVLGYRFEPPLEIPSGASLEVAYTVTSARPDGGGTAGWKAALVWEYAEDAAAGGGGASLGGDAWELPLDAAFLGFSGVSGISYALPAAPGRIAGFRLSGGAAGGGAGSGDGAGPLIQLRSLRLVPRWYGMEAAGGGLRATPFVYRDTAGRFVIDPPAAWLFSAAPALTVRAPAGGAEFEWGNRRFEYTPGSNTAHTTELLLPPGLLRFQDRASRPLTAGFSAGSPPAAMTLARAQDAAGRSGQAGLRTAGSPAPTDPIPLDPGLILAYPQESWRDGRFEVFRWDEFPDIIIFDTVDYALQNRLFKRIAFFVEKAGYRGALVTDGELADLHGWNAHDYRAEDLAVFFEAARTGGFPLLPEETELEGLLLDYGILARAASSITAEIGSITAESGGITAGRGAVLSLSQESPAYLRRRFMVHEAYHGIYFLDEAFRDFSRGRWENLAAEPKRFLRSYLDSQRYDLNDAYLIINEFMAYCLQQAIEQAGPYFGESLARQIDANSWRRAVLPPESYRPDGSKTWPTLAAAFEEEARAFSAYAARRWGFAAGSIGRFRVTGP